MNIPSIGKNAKAFANNPVNAITDNENLASLERSSADIKNMIKYSVILVPSGAQARLKMYAPPIPGIPRNISFNNIMIPSVNKVIFNIRFI